MSKYNLEQRRIVSKISILRKRQFELRRKFLDVDVRILALRHQVEELEKFKRKRGRKL